MILLYYSASLSTADKNYQIFALTCIFLPCTEHSIYQNLQSINKKQMFKLLTQMILVLVLIVCGIHCVPVQTISYCVGNCTFCPNNPYKCPFNASLLYPSQNYNCLPYSFGPTCQNSTSGYEIVKQNGSWLNGWLPVNQTTQTETRKCTFYHLPESVAPFQVVGPIVGLKNITKIVPITRDIIDAIVLKISFTINATNIFKNQTSTTAPPQIPNNTDPTDAPPIGEGGTVNTEVVSGQVNGSTTNKQSNLTNRAFVDVEISISGTNQKFKLELNYPTKPRDQSRVVNTTCGVHLQYIHTHIFNESLKDLSNNALNITIISISKDDSNASWSLAKMQVYTGCAGLLLDVGNQRCKMCLSGYYPIRNIDGSYSGCGLCPSSCQTCVNPQRCTLCSPNAVFNQATGKCEYNSTYTQVKQNKVEIGQRIDDTSTQDNFYNLIQISDQQITIKSELTSPSPYLIRFYLIYNREFIQSLKSTDTVDVLNSAQKVYKSIPASQFREEIGLYDKRLLNGVRYYVKKIEIDMTNFQNVQKVLQITIKSRSQSNNLYVANYQVQHYQCAAGCIQCDRTTNKCLQCDRFYSNKDGLSCIHCANGFFLKRSWNDTNSTTSLDMLSQDICVKCHSTCKQCTGPQINQCSQCFKLFNLDNVVYKRQCIECLYKAKNNPNGQVTPQCRRCLNVSSTNQVFANTDCSLCTKDTNTTIQNILIGELCSRCWISQGLAHGRCVPIQSSGLVFYGQDVSNGVIDTSGWSVSGDGGKLQRYNCTKDYQDLWGIQNTNSQDKVTLQWQQKNLPPHYGLYAIFNIFKVDTTPITNTNGSKLSQFIYLQMDQANGNKKQNLEIMNKVSGFYVVPGSNICGKEQNQMIYTYYFDSFRHDSPNFVMKITSQGGGIYIRQVELYLGNCNKCYSNNLNYEVSYMPRYLYDNSASPGLDVYIQFSKPVEVSNSTNLTQAFTFQIDSLPNLKLNPKEFYNQLQLNNRLKYFIPLNQSFKNATLVVNANPKAKIFGLNNKKALQSSRRLLLNSPLIRLLSERFINRFNRLPVDDLVSTSQMYWFYTFFQWFALITMIVCIMLGVGVVFEDFSIMLQLLFLHVYISSTIQPASYKAPMIGLSRMEHLNYFAVPSAMGIQNQWFGNYQHPSPFVFQQYNKDILFLRSFYPTIIINLIYLGWFILLFIIYKVIRRFQSTQNPCFGFLRNIPGRPLNYFDQIWRYQFITTVWAAIMQFHILKNDTAWQRLNLAICFISFIITIIWPFFVVCYTYRLTQIKYTADYMYKYEDIYFKKMQTMGQNKIKYYYYVFVRFFRLFIMTLFICVFTGYEIIAPIILIVANVIEILYVVFMKIFYNSNLATLFKVLENILFIAIEVAMLFVYGLSQTSRQTDFINLGNAINVMYVIMIFLGLLRFAYYVYLKFREYFYNLKVGAENGETINAPIPTTQRPDVLFTNNQLIN